jgi:hypothetical protein
MFLVKLLAGSNFAKIEIAKVNILRFQLYLSHSNKGIKHSEDFEENN